MDAGYKGDCMIGTRYCADLKSNDTDGIDFTVVNTNQNVRILFYDNSNVVMNKILFFWTNHLKKEKH